MTDRQKRYRTGLWLARLVAWAPPLIFIISVGVYLVSVGDLFKRNLPALLASGAGLALHREITIGGISASRGFNQIVFTNVAVSDAPTFALGHGRRLVTAPRVTVDLDVAGIKSDPTDAGAYIQLITVYDPVGYVVRRTNTNFNFSNLFKKTKSKPNTKNFAAVIRVVNGTVTFQDSLAPANYQPAINHLTNLNGNLSFAAPHQISFDASANGASNRFKAAQVDGDIVFDPVKGQVDDRIGGYDIRIHGQDANAPYLVGYFLQKELRPVGTVTKGIGDVSLTLSQRDPQPKTPLDIAGYAHVRGGQVVFVNRAILRQPIDNVNGLIRFTTDSLSLNASATAGGMPVQAVGSIPSFNHPTLSFRGTAPQVDIARLHSVLPFVVTLPDWLSHASRASAVATADGPILTPTFNVAFADPGASVYGVALHSVRGGLTFQGKTLILRSVVASTGNRHDNVAITGIFNTGQRVSGHLSAHATGVDLASTQLPGNLRRTLGGVTGSADGDLQLASPDFANPTAASRLVVTARVRAGSVHGLPIDQGAVQLTANGTSAHIDRLVAVQPDGAVVSASGVTPLAPTSTSPLHLDIAASGLNLGLAARQFGFHQVSGIGYFRGHVNGTFAAPRLTGRASVFNAGYGNIAADHARANIAVNSNTLSITSGAVQRLGVNAEFSALVSGLNTRKPQIAASASTRNAEIEALTLIATEAANQPGAKRLPPSLRQIAANATGTLNADVSVHGPLSAPAISARASANSAVVDSLQISRLQTQAELNQGVLRVSELAAQIDGANIAASGTLNLRTKVVRADVQANSADLSQQSTAAGLGKIITGSASARAVVAGTYTNPSALVTANLSNGAYRDVQVNTSQIALRYADGRLQSVAGEPLVVQSGPATYSLSGFDYNARTKTIAVDATVAGEQIARLVSIAKNLAPGNSVASSELSQLPPGLAGALDVTSFQLSGPIAKPNARIAVALHNLTLGQPGEDKLEVIADASYSGGTTTLSSLEARGPVEYLSANGSFTPNGPLDAHVDASGFPLSFLHLVNPTLANIGGTLSDLTLVAGGNAAQPVVNASISLANVSDGSISVDRIDSGRITAANNRIDIAGLSLVKLEQPPAGTPGGAPIQHTALLQGYLPFQFSLKNGVTAAFPADGKVALTASLPTQSVSLLTLFSPALKSLKLNGTLSADVNINGTLATKTIQGGITLANASVQPAGFKTTLQNINLSAKFNGEHGTISSSQIKSSAGGYVTLGGTVDVPQAAENASYASVAQALLGSLRLHLTAQAKNFTINEPKIASLYNAGAQGVINGQAQVNGALLSPAITGNLIVTKAVGYLPTIAPAVSAPQPPPAFNPTFKVAVVIAPGTQVKSSQLNAVVDGRAEITRSLYQPDIEGDFNVRSGNLNFYTARFRVVPTGAVHISYNPPDDPVERVDLTATTSLSISPSVLASNPRGASSLTSGEPFTYNEASVFSPVQSNASQRYTITVMIQGDLGQPSGLHLTFDSDPPGLSNEQILAALGGQQVLSSLLVGGNVQAALQTEAQQVFTGYALPTLLAPFESSVAQAFGLQEIDVDYEPESPLLITLYKQITPRVQIRYTKFVNSRQSSGAVGSTLTPLEYSVAVDYYFTNKFRLDVSTDDQHNTTFGIGGAVNF